MQNDIDAILISAGDDVVTLDVYKRQVTDSPRREFTAWALCLPLSLLYLMAFTLGLQVW